MGLEVALPVPPPNHSSPLAPKTRQESVPSTSHETCVVEFVGTIEGLMNKLPLASAGRPQATAPPTQANQTWETLCALAPCYGLAWAVEESLGPGESVTLTSTPDSYWGPNTVWPGAFAAGTSDLYLYVDSYSTGGEASGAVAESDEGNNRAERHWGAGE